MVREDPGTGAAGATVRPPAARPPVALHPAVLTDLLDAEVRQARLKLDGQDGDLRRVGTMIEMTLIRDDGTWNLQLDGSRYDSEPLNGTAVPTTRSEPARLGAVAC